MNVIDAAKELYKELRIYEEVVGIDVQSDNKIEYIVVFLAISSEWILQKIPPIYNGIIVKVEITGKIFLQ